MENVLRIEIEKQHQIIGEFIDEWKNYVEPLNDIADYKKWLYKMHYYIVYHLYSEEQFFDNNTDYGKSHKEKHRWFLSEIYSVLASDVTTIHAIRSHINLIFDYYLKKHISNMDAHIVYQNSERLDDYFAFEDNHCGIVVTYFKKGYLASFYGSVTKHAFLLYEKENAKYFSRFSEDEQQWHKCIDLSNWNYATNDTVEESKKYNETERMNHQKSCFYFSNDDQLTNFLIERVILKERGDAALRTYDEMLSTEAVLEILSSDVLDFVVIGDKSYIDQHYKKESIVEKTN